MRRGCLSCSAASGPHGDRQRGQTPQHPGRAAGRGTGEGDVGESLEQPSQGDLELDPGEPYRLTGDPVGIARELCEALDDAQSRCPRLIHGAGAWTWPLVEEAFRRRDHTRVGFEDSVLLPDGRRASDNAELVRAAVRLRLEVTRITS